jgi:hypothetical protein
LIRLPSFAAILAALVLAPVAPYAAPAVPDDTPADPAGAPSVEPAPAVPERPKGNIEGRASLGHRQRVVGATVFVVAADEEAPDVYLTATDEDGEFRVEGLRNDDYRVLIRRDGLGSVYKERVTVRYPFRAVVEVLMKPGEESAVWTELVSEVEAAEGRTVRLDGEVRHRQDLHVIGDVELRLVRTDSAEDPRSLRSGPTGRFAFEDLTVGSWRLEVRGAGFLPLRATLPLRRDNRLNVRLVEQPVDYKPSPWELMPTEEPIPPAGMETDGQSADPAPRTAK